MKKKDYFNNDLHFFVCSFPPQELQKLVGDHFSRILGVLEEAKSGIFPPSPWISERLDLLEGTASSILQEVSTMRQMMDDERGGMPAVTSAQTQGLPGVDRLEKLSTGVERLARMLAPPMATEKPTADNKFVIGNITFPISDVYKIIELDEELQNDLTNGASNDQGSYFKRVVSFIESFMHLLDCRRI